MALAGSLQKVFLDGLRDLYDAEHQLAKALPELAGAATSPELSRAFSSHLAKTEEHIERLKRVFEHLGETASGKHCPGVAGIIEEGAAMVRDDLDNDTMDACLIAAGQRAEHYEIAAYGTLVAWARSLGHTQVSELLQDTLDDETRADVVLTSLAEGGINQDAGYPGPPSEGSTDDGESAVEPFPAGIPRLVN